MSLDQPYQARDINFNALGRLEIYDGPAQMDQMVYRFLSARVKAAIGRKQQGCTLDTYLRAQVVSISQDITRIQATAPNYRQYQNNELVDSLALIGIEQLDPSSIIVKIKVYLKSGSTFDTSVGVLS